MATIPTPVIVPQSVSNTNNTDQSTIQNITIEGNVYGGRAGARDLARMIAKAQERDAARQLR